MKKMIFILSACALSSLASSSIFADETTVATDSTANTKYQKEHHHHRKPVRHRATVAAKTEQAPKEATSKSPEATTPPSWQDNLSGFLTFTSNYVFRGISQTENLPAVQGSLNYDFPVGLYLNTWASNVKFPDTDAVMEWDAIVGWKGDFWEDFSYNLNFDRYFYPGAEELAYNEFNSVFNYKIFQFGYSYSGNGFASHAPSRYYLVGINYDIPPNYVFCLEDVSVHGTFGHFDLPKAAGNSYNDYSVWIAKKLFKNYTLTAQWTDTNHRNPPYDGSNIFLLLEADF